MEKILPENVHEVLSKYMLADGFDMVLDFERSKGCHIYDSKNKRTLLDFFSFFASAPLSFNHPKMLEKDFLEKLGKIAAHKPSNSDIYTVEMAEFVETFARIAKPDYLHYLFFISGGALAVENALKAAFDWKVRKNFKKGYREEKGHQVIHFREAFHGRTGYTMSLTNTDPTKTMYFPKFNWPRINNPKIHFPLTDEEVERVKREEEIAISQIKEAIKNNKDDIAALIIEPIQGEGGDNHFRGEFFKKLREITLEEDIMLIFDEVQTGVGITGKFWAHQHFDVEPDMICFGKKTQVCGIAVSKRIDEVEDNVFHLSSRINSTWGGNLVDMVRSKRYLEIIEEENLVENAAKMGDYLLKKLEEIGENHGNLVENIRGRGLFAAFDFKDKDHRNSFLSKSRENGILLLPCGEKSVRFRPPLDVTVDVINEGIEIIEKTLKEVE